VSSRLKAEEKREKKVEKSKEEEIEVSEVLKVIDQWRNESDKEESAPSHTSARDDSDEEEDSDCNGALRRNNVAPEKVVEVIKSFRKVEYKKHQYSPEATTFKQKYEEVIAKRDEIREIFRDVDQEMEWEK
jgi:hypothetical protein